LSQGVLKSRFERTQSDIVAEDIFEPHILAKYDPEVVKYVVKSKQSGRQDQEKVSIKELRENREKYAPPWSKDVTGWERVTDAEITSVDGTMVPIKIYHPDTIVYGDGPYGVHLNFHGRTWCCMR